MALRKREPAVLLQVSVTVCISNFSAAAGLGSAQEHSCAEEGEGISAQRMLLSAAGLLWFFGSRKHGMQNSRQSPTESGHGCVLASHVPPPLSS